MIRAYVPEDDDALLAIWRDANALAHPFLAPAFVAQVAHDMRAIYLPNAETWVTEVEGAPVGFIALLGNEIGGLFLAPARHGQGLGRAMADHAVALKGPLCVEVFEDNAIGRAFYDRYGFVGAGAYLHEPSGAMTLRMAMPS